MMRSVLFLISFLLGSCCLGQDSLKLGLATNLGKLMYQTMQADFMVSGTGSRIIGLLGISYAKGMIYGGNRFPVDDRYMESRPSKMNGFGADLQFRYNISQYIDNKLVVYFALGAIFNQYHVTFYENQYKLDPSTGMYKYGLEEYKTSFSQSAVYAQVIFSGNIYQRLILEFGGGIANNSPNTSDLLNTYRDFGQNEWGYAVNGISPVFTLRLGYWLY